MRVKTVRKYNSGKVKQSKPKLRINWWKPLLILTILAVISYGIYAFISFRSIKAQDPLRNEGGHYYLLSKNRDDFKKTLIIFENTRNDQDVIEQVYIFGENAQKQQSVLVHIPGWVYYGGLENDFGNAVPVSSFRYAGDFLQEGKGVEYAIWQLEQLMGINFDEYIWLTPTALQSIEKNLGDIDGDVLYSEYYQNGNDISQDSLFLNSFVSHLNWVRLVLVADRFQNSNAVIYSSHPSIMNVFLTLKQIQSSIYATKPYMIDLSTGDNIIQKESSTSGGMINFVNSIEFDKAWRNLTSKMLDKGLEQERVRVEIYNGSGIPGAAAQFARRIQNAGCEVVRYENAPELVETTKFYVPNPDLYVNSLSSISELFPGQYDELNERPLFMTTGDIVIVLGEDISRMYSF